MIKRVLFILIALVVASLFIVAHNYLTTFLATSGLTIPALKTSLSAVHPDFSSANVLLLGLDNRADQIETTLLTDSLILASYHATTATATLVPLPRDLWLPDLQAKINSLYYYGTQNGQGSPYVTTQVSRLTGQSIPYYMIVNYQVLPQAIDLLGGVDVVVQQTFTDPEFPNPAYFTDHTQPIYIIVTFTAGTTHMDGTTALIFMRSRHSTDLAEGSDDARSARQLLVFQALVKKMSQPALFTNPKLVGQLYAFYHTSITTNLTDADLLSLAWATYPHRHITLHPISASHLFVHPSVTKYGQWVWELADPSGKSFKDFIASALN